MTVAHPVAAFIHAEGGWWFAFTGAFLLGSIWSLLVVAYARRAQLGEAIETGIVLAAFAFLVGRIARGAWDRRGKATWR